MVAERPLRIGLVGGGSMGALHARVIAQEPATELVWIAEPDAIVGRELAQRFGARWMPTPGYEGVDAVVVAAPTQHHRELALAVLGRGLPLLLEKPLAPTLNESVEIVELAEREGTVLMCGLLERFNPAVRTAVEICREPLHVQTIRHSPYASRIRTGVAGDLLIHDVDLVMRLMDGMPIGHSCSFGYFEPRSEPGSEDVAEAHLSFDGGRVASLSVSRIAQRKVRSLMISEIARSIEVDLLRQAITVYRDAGSSRFDEEAGYTQQMIIDIPVIRHLGEPLSLQLRHFVDLVRERSDAAQELEGILASHTVLDRLSRDAASQG